MSKFGKSAYISEPVFSKRLIHEVTKSCLHQRSIQNINDYSGLNGGVPNGTQDNLYYPGEA